ncbi:hypothetical protein SAMN04488543_2699 [Friedmanniella luteola]|uniref:Uncharacterized protein n=1 Tax=Friedmanniella luteola TaxID=546871 RepID=A0A1H1WDW5_9ACTN|nr:hypothetical protein [Friedmanniella luteola]SDS94850.1 hypothetical protein SAMN04488543_2699 [Friedmanniella luteola]
MSIFESLENETFEGPGHELESHEWESAGESYESHEFHEIAELNESTELELAQELLEITSEEELEQFLGKLVRSVAKGASSLIRSPIGKALGGVLRGVAKTALPVVGSALGSFVAPGIGTAIGGKLGSMASSLLEAEERETMNESEAEFEAARRYVRWAAGTVRNSARAPRGVPPRVVVRSAAVSSARRYAPSLLGASSRSTWGSSPWRRRRGPGWSTPDWGGAAGRRRRVCTCGAGGAEPGGDDGDRYGAADDGDGEDETFESHELSQGSGANGRWVRRGKTITLYEA